MNQKPEIYEHREGWLGARGIGGSDVGAIMGLSSFKTTAEVATEKIYGSQIDENNPLLVNGTKAEPHIRELFALSTQDEFEVMNPPEPPKAWLFRQKDNPFLTCSPDGLLKRKSDGTLGGLEIKFSGITNAAMAEKWQDNIPTQYFAQCAWYLACIPELQFVVLCAFLKHYRYDDEGNATFTYAEMKTYEVNRNDPSTKDFIEKAVKKAKMFHDAVEQRLLPPETFTINEDNL